MPVQVVPCPVVPAGGARVGVAGGDLDIPERAPRRPRRAVMKLCLRECREMYLLTPEGRAPPEFAGMGALPLSRR